MASQKFPVLAYLNSKVYSCLVEFKQANELRSLSASVELILAKFFGISDLVGSSGLKLGALSEQEQMQILICHLNRCHESLSKDVAQLQQLAYLIHQSQRNQSNQSREQTTSELPILLTTEAASETEVLSPELTELCFLTGLTPESIQRGLKGVELAKRLNTYPSEITRRRLKREGFEQWSRSLDPQQIAWQYGNNRRYYPV